MHRLISILAAVVMLFALSATALGASPSERDCEAAGGTYTHVQGEANCELTETVGNAPATSNAQTVDSSESSQGTLDNKPKHQQECTGPGQGGSTAQCP
jgi:hypothetical protein